VPVSQEVLGVCELLGFDALGLANEGTFVLCVKKDDASKALEILKSFDDQATEIGLVTDSDKNRVVLQSAWGTSRILELPSGELLPRIC
ncbi:MAG: AIR synthase-related protein, partial [Thiovulaceae bacterium]|nr:AIR synthase-related protein [Sulfurimonadaceae bacterium]